MNAGLMQFLSVVAAPAITAAVSVLGVYLRERQARRSRDHQRQKQLEQARREIEIISAYLSARKEAGMSGGPEQQGALLDLDSIYQDMKARRPESDEQGSALNLRGIVALILLPGRPARGFLTILFRVVYYVVLSTSLLFAMAAVDVTMDDFTVINLLASVIAFGIAGVLPALGMWWSTTGVSRWSTRRRKERISVMEHVTASPAPQVVDVRTLEERSWAPPASPHS
jgi:hypothetical protein